MNNNRILEQLVSANSSLSTVAGSVGSSLTNVNLSKVNGTSVSLGNTTMSASLPMTIASNDTLFAANNTKLDTLHTDLTNIPNVIKTLGTDSYTEATTKGIVCAGVRNDNGSTTLVNNDNEICPIGLTHYGAVHSFLTDVEPKTAGSGGQVSYADGNRVLVIGGPRNNSQTTRAGNDGDYGPINIDIVGNLLTDTMRIGNTAIAVNSGTNSNGTQRVTIATDDAINTKLTDIPNIIKTIGSDTYTEATTKGIILCGVRNDNSSTTFVSTNNEICPLGVSEKGNVMVRLQSINGSTPATNSGTLDGGTQRVTIATDDNVSSKLTSIDTTLTNIYTLLNDIYNSTNHYIRTHETA